MITEADISKAIGRDIYSPIRMGDVIDFGIELPEFKNFFKPFFESLQDDLYAVREKQVSFLISQFPNEATEIQQYHRSYFEGDVEIKVFKKWIDRYTEEQKSVFKELSLVTRQRNISSFLIDLEQKLSVTRMRSGGYTQKVEDFRVWKREFEQAVPEAVENKLFFKLLAGVGNIVKSLHPEVAKLKITSHFMRTICYDIAPGENSPEGIHEDGTPYIMSALVVDRNNITGAESQVFEKTNSKPSQELIYSKTLESGEFIFQADTGEEKTYGNDLWHYVTPTEPIDKSTIGTRDIIGFDIEIIE